jgi:hypothetical protein
VPGRRRTRPAPGAAVIAASPWIVVGIGVAVLVVLLVVAFLAMPQRRDPVTLPSRAPALPAPVQASPTPGPVRPSISAPPTTPRSPGAGRSTAAPVTPARPATPAPTSAAGATPSPVRPSTPAASASTTARYRSLSSFADGFIGEVLVTNGGPGAQRWRVRLTLPEGRLVTSWVEGGTPASVSRSGPVYVFTGAAELAPGTSASLRFHVAGTAASKPVGCTVDGVACTGL